MLNFMVEIIFFRPESFRLGINGHGRRELPAIATVYFILSESDVLMYSARQENMQNMHSVHQRRYNDISDGSTDLFVLFILSYRPLHLDRKCFLIINTRLKLPF